MYRKSLAFGGALVLVMYDEVKVLLFGV